MRYLKAFGRFWYDFVIGDDYKIALSVVVALVLTALLMFTGALPDSTVALLGGLLVMAAFTTSLLIDVRDD